jgi:Cu(I)/Ag(I) efflux system membrane fusion protein
MMKTKVAGIALPTVIFSAITAVILLAVYFIYPHVSISWLDARTASPNTATTPEGTKLSLFDTGQAWVCPMHPEIIQDHPGSCPICGMDLVESKNHTGHEQGIHIDTASVQKLGVRLAKVKKFTFASEVRTYGNVSNDDSAVYNIHSKFDGLIKKSHIHSIGQKIKQGQVIYEIYSPDLIAQQIEFLRFLERRNQILRSIGDARFQEDEYVMTLLQDFSRQRTRFLHEDISFDTIQKIEDSKMILEVVEIVAAQSGVVTKINAREGSYVMPAATLFTLTDVSRVWIDIALYPDQVDQVQTGDKVSIRSADGQKAGAKLSFIPPLAENNIVNARVEIDNRHLHLRPGSFVDVSIHSDPHEALTVPRSAVLRSGEGNVVMLHRGDGHFLPAYVDTGIENDDVIEITDGLQPGAEVAVNGQFLLDSAASMNAAIERMQSSENMATHEQMQPDAGTEHTESMSAHEGMGTEALMAPTMHDAASGMHDAQ